MWPAIETLLPTAGLLFLFYVIMKHIMEGDRRERAAQAEWDREHPAAATSPEKVDSRESTGSDHDQS